MDDATSGPAPAIRAARRSDLQTLTDLRMRFLGEAAHDEPRLRLTAAARARTEHALPVWMGQEDRVLVVAEVGEGEDRHVVAYGMGYLRTVPPVLVRRHVGEILEVFVVPELRGEGHATAIVKVLTDALVGRGAEVLRAAVPSTHPSAQARLERAGYVPVQVELERTLGRG
jgi:GNAT superfamily N-acetyltransferase